MKTKRSRIILQYLLLFSFTFYVFGFSSCETTQAQNDVMSTALADGEAAFAAYEASMGLAAFPPYGTIAQGAVVIVAAAVGSYGEGNRRSHIYLQGSPHPDLPDGLYLSNNPYEIYGKMHNDALGKIIESGSYTKVYDSLRNYDEAMWKIYIGLNPEAVSPSLQEAIFNNIRNNTTMSVIDDRLNELAGVETLQDAISILHMSVEGKELVSEIMTVYNNLLASQSTPTQICNYLNHEIGSLLPNPHQVINNERKGIIIMFTVLKHSHYYWND